MWLQYEHYGTAVLYVAALAGLNLKPHDLAPLGSQRWQERTAEQYVSTDSEVKSSSQHLQNGKLIIFVINKKAPEVHVLNRIAIKLANKHVHLLSSR